MLLVTSYVSSCNKSTCQNVVEWLDDLHGASGPHPREVMADILHSVIHLCICSGPPNTAPQQTTTVTVLEGSSVNISCTSTGNPIPTILWELQGSPAPFQQSSRVSGYQATMTGNQQLSFTQGNISSVLHITSAAYPAHNGQYTCVGFSLHSGKIRTNNATISVNVQGMQLNCVTIHVI